MPPKKVSAKQKIDTVSSNNGEEPVAPPINTIEFRIEMEAKHEAGHYLKVKYNWISVDQASGSVSYP